MGKNGIEKKETKFFSSSIIFWTVCIIAVLIISYIFLSSHSKPKEKTEVTIDYTNQPYLGDSSSPVSIVEFGDYKCPICKDFEENAVPEIKQKLVDSGKAKLYFMNDAFINVDSVRSAKFAESVYQELGNNKFWEFHNLLYKKQPKESKFEKMDIYNEKFLTNVLNEIASKSDTKKVIDNFHSKKSDIAFNRDMNYVKKFGIRGTPTFYINGKLFEGETIDDIISMVDEASKK